MVQMRVLNQIESHWVTRQYLLGTREDEREGAYVVFTILYQPWTLAENNDDILIIEIAKTNKNVVHDVIHVGGSAIVPIMQ